MDIQQRRINSLADKIMAVEAEEQLRQTDLAYLALNYKQRVAILERLEYINQQNIYKIQG